MVSSPLGNASRCIIVCFTVASCFFSCRLCFGDEHPSLETQIWAAVQIGSTNLLDQVLGNGSVDINNIVNAQGESPLHSAARNGYSDVVTRLLAAGANIERRDYRGETALMEACLLRRLKCVKALLKGGADVHATNYNGMSAIDYTRITIKHFRSSSSNGMSDATLSKEIQDALREAGESQAR